MISAQWLNPEETTLEVVIDGTTSYAMKVDGVIKSADNNLTTKILEWMDEGNTPRPSYNPSLGG